MTPTAPFAYFLVRAWAEHGRVYARITSSLNLDEAQVKHLTNDPEEVARRLKAWLLEIGTEHDPADTTPTCG